MWRSLQQDQTVKSHLKSTDNQSYRAKFNWPKFLLLFNRLCMSKTTHALKQSCPHQSLNRAFHLPLLLHPSLFTASWVRMEKCLSASGFTVSLWHTRREGSREENRDGERNKDSKSKIKWTLCSVNNEVQPRFAFTSFSFSCLEYIETWGGNSVSAWRWTLWRSANVTVYQESSTSFGPCH